VTDEEFDEFKVEAAFSALEEISLFAKQRGVEVLIENTPNGLASAERLLTFFELTHLNLNVCLDVGHAHMNEGVETAYKLLKPRIRSTHIHDNDGEKDSHLFPLDGAGGTIDWTATMDLLRSAEHQYPLLLELREVEGMDQPIRKAKSILERLEELRSES
jgi:sugar phosphate isomerase/epimerase